jgi:hypothetical protein
MQKSADIVIGNVIWEKRVQNAIIGNPTLPHNKALQQHHITILHSGNASLFV